MKDAILLVDDDINVTCALSRLLQQDRLETHIANNAHQALELLNQYPIKVVVCDQRMPQISGTQLLAKIKHHHPDIVSLMLSGHMDAPALREALNNGGIHKCLTKPWDADTVREQIHDALCHYDRQQQYAHLSAIFTHTSEALLLCDESGNVLRANPAYTTLTNFTPTEIIGQNCQQLLLNQNQQTLTTTTIRHTPTRQWQSECLCLTQSGEHLPIWLNAIVINRPGNTLYYAFLFIDISAQKRKEAERTYQAFHDELTGLPNRRLLHQRLEQALQHPSRDPQGLGLALLFIDLDRFKAINDSLGHEVGDLLLCAVANRLASTLRQGETLARFGGDEFVTLLPQLHHQEDAMVLREQMMASLNTPFTIRQHSIHIRASIGISNSLNQAQQAQCLLRQADAAMYRNKHAHHQQPPQEQTSADPTSNVQRLDRGRSARYPRLSLLLLLICFSALLSIPTWASPALWASYYADERGFNTTHLGYSSNHLPAGFTLWGFTDFHADRSNRASRSDSSDYFSESRLTKMINKYWGVQAEYNDASGNNNHLGRIGIVYKYFFSNRLFNNTLLILRALPYQTDGEGGQISLSWRSFIITPAFIFEGFADYNIKPGQDNRIVFEPQLRYMLGARFGLVLEYRYNEFFNNTDNNLQGFAAGAFYQL